MAFLVNSFTYSFLSLLGDYLQNGSRRGNVWHLLDKTADGIIRFAHASRYTQNQPQWFLLAVEHEELVPGVTVRLGPTDHLADLSKRSAFLLDVDLFIVVPVEYAPDDPDPYRKAYIRNIDAARGVAGAIIDDILAATQPPTMTIYDYQNATTAPPATTGLRATWRHWRAEWESGGEGRLVGGATAARQSLHFQVVIEE